MMRCELEFRRKFFDLNRGIWVTIKWLEMEDGRTIILLLLGGDKSSQTKDIAAAQEFWNSYLEVKRHGKTK